MLDADGWIEALGLQQHPEGGWFREIYRSSETIPRQGLPGRFPGDRQFSTAIYFLLRGAEFSALHRIRQDEVWHFYDGGPVTVHMLDPAGEYSAAKLGRDITSGETLVATIPAGWLFGATVDDPSSYALVGCTVAPGFDFDDFEMPGRDELLQQYPHQRELIERLTS